MKFQLSAGGTQESNSESEVMKDWHDQAAFRAPAFWGTKGCLGALGFGVGGKVALLGEVCCFRICVGTTGLVQAAQVHILPSRECDGLSRSELRMLCGDVCRAHSS